MRSYDKRKKNNIIIGSLLGVLLLMVVGYAAFNSVLNIQGTSGISSNWNVLITNVVSKNITGGATNAQDPTWDGLTATFKTNLVSPGDSIEYDITVSNKGNLNATLDKIKLSDPNNPAIIFTASGLTEGDTLAAGQSTVLTVKVEYDKNVTTQPGNTTGTLDVTLDFVQEGKEINTPIKNPANVEITNIEPTNAVGLAAVASEPSYYGLNATLKTNLTNQDDSLEYNITIQNQGDEAATLTGLTVNEENKVATITSSGVTEGETLQGNGTKVMKVKVAKSSQAPAGQVEAEVNVSLEYTASGTTGEKAAAQLIATAIDTGDGLYKDEYEEGRYVYKGANPNNHITFNNETWRILAVESDGTLKIMKKDSIGTKPWDASANYNGSNDWVKPATLNKYLNDENDENSYYNSLSSETKGLIQKHAWGIGKVTNHNRNLGTQITSENGTIWTGNLGLMSVSDFIKANTNTAKCGSLTAIGSYMNCKTTNYLVPTKGNLWNISPDAGSTNMVFNVDSNGWFSTTDASAYNDVHPALYLTPEITLSGEGTEANPYTINS